MTDWARMDRGHLTAGIKRKARELGFDWARLAPVAEPPHIDFYATWATPAYTGDMDYLTRHLDRRRDPRLLSEHVDLRSIIVLGVNYHQFALPDNVRRDPSRGMIASYAWGDDYHDIIKPLLIELDAFIAGQTGRTSHGKCLVDTGPVLERDWALWSGLGFTGKNCCTIHPGTGSWLFLATVMVPEELAYDASPEFDGPTVGAGAIFAGLPGAVNIGTWTLTADSVPRVGTCGRCTRCLTACPTDAFVGPFHLNPQRCIAYWTIETQAPIPVELRPLFGNRIFGCDICQEVCPWNRRLPARIPQPTALQAQDGRMAPPLLEGFDAGFPYWLDDDAFRVQFRRSPIKRAKRRGMLRNVCVALGNWADPTAVPALVLALHDDDPLPRGHAAWALGQIVRRHAHSAARTALVSARATETDMWVEQELHAALAYT